MGLALAGLASDARVLSNFLKQQSLSSRMTFGRALPVERAISAIGDRAQKSTQQYGKRPYGVGLLVAGVDESGPHLFEFQPSGMTQEMLACAIGARSQMARTYLERNIDQFAKASREELVKHGLKALKESLAQDKELTVDNTSIGIVGARKEGTKSIEAFKLYNDQEAKVWIEMVADGNEGDNETTTAADTSGDAPAAGGDSMEVDS